MRRVEQIMGLPITVDIPDCQNQAVFDKVFKRLRQIDRRFSTYKHSSEVFKYISGKLEKGQLSNELQTVIKECRLAEKMTNGYFSAWTGGQFDPSGYVKGWAIDQAGRIIEKSGYPTYCLNAGGDILARSAGPKKWIIGIQDPIDKTTILNKLSISNGAVCTSGNYERGAHIINPKTGQPADEVLSVTIIGPDIIKADILATACFAMGHKAAEYIKNQKAYKALIIPRVTR